MGKYYRRDSIISVEYIYIWLNFCKDNHFFCALKIGGLGVTQGKRIKIIKLIGKT